MIVAELSAIIISMRALYLKKYGTMPKTIDSLCLYMYGFLRLICCPYLIIEYCLTATFTCTLYQIVVGIMIF